MNEPDRLAECPNRNNCVSSEARDPKHAVAPMQLTGDPVLAWNSIQSTIMRLPRCTIVNATDQYLHSILKSRLWGFVDDLELTLDLQTRIIDIRSASRRGYYDFGVNRRRVETLRLILKTEGLIL